MNGKATKLCRRWAKVIWEQSSQEERASFNSFDHFFTKVKDHWKTKEQFKKFVHYTKATGIIK